MDLAAPQKRLTFVPSRCQICAGLCIDAVCARHGSEAVKKLSQRPKARNPAVEDEQFAKKIFHGFQFFHSFSARPFGYGVNERVIDFSASEMGEKVEGWELRSG